MRFQDENGIELLGVDIETGLPLINAEHVEVCGVEGAVRDSWVFCQAYFEDSNSHKPHLHSFLNLFGE